MPDYDSNHFEPPAPVAQVTLKDAKTSAIQEEVPMLLDTGADVTLLPLHAVTAMPRRNDLEYGPLRPIKSHTPSKNRTPRCSSFAVVSLPTTFITQI